MKNFQHTRNHFVLFIAGIGVAIGLAYALTIETSIINTIQYIQKVMVTDDGTSDGTPYIILNKEDNGEVFISNKIGLGTSGSNAKLNIRTNAYNEVEFSNTEDANVVAPNANLYIKAGASKTLNLGANNTNNQIVLSGDQIKINNGTSTPIKTDSAGIQVGETGYIKLANNAISTNLNDTFWITNNSTGQNINIRIKKINSNNLNALIINGTTGYVGIGDATPTEKLTVNGAIKIGETENTDPESGTIVFSGDNKFYGYNGSKRILFGSGQY